MRYRRNAWVATEVLAPLPRVAVVAAGVAQVGHAHEHPVRAPVAVAMACSGAPNHHSSVRSPGSKSRRAEEVDERLPAVPDGVVDPEDRLRLRYSTRVRGTATGS